MLRRTALKSRQRREWEAQRAARSEREPKPLHRLERPGVYSGTTAGPAPKAPEPVRDEDYRRWVASLPCYECRIHGYSQCAHPNSGKAKGKKQSDAGCFPMCCDRPGVKGCHSRFDQYEIVSRAEMPQYERAALAWTQEQRRLA